MMTFAVPLRGVMRNDSCLLSLCLGPWGNVYIKVYFNIKLVFYQHMQCSAVQCSAVQCSAVQCIALQCRAVHVEKITGKTWSCTYILSVCRLSTRSVSCGSRNQWRATGCPPDWHWPHGSNLAGCSWWSCTADPRDGETKRCRLGTRGALSCAIFRTLLATIITAFRFSMSLSVNGVVHCGCMCTSTSSPRLFNRGKFQCFSRVVWSDTLVKQLGRRMWVSCHGNINCDTVVFCSRHGVGARSCHW